MKKYISCFMILSLSIAYAQVGIGTKNPQADLHVNGDILVQESISTGILNSVTATDEDFKLITRVTNSSPVGQVTVLDVDPLSVAPINTIDYHFTDISLDNLTDLDLLYDANKYIVAIANFRYVGDPIKKTPSGSTYSIGHFVYRVFVSGGTWHLEIRNRSLDLDVGDSVEYYATLIIYDKSYFRNLPSIFTNLGGNNTGTASSVPNLY